MVDEQTQNIQISNKRIAKNATLLYARTFITMIVGLYTSRIILRALGVEDYGIYNVVGGFVSMFALITSSIQSSITRFLTFELGRGDIDKLQKIFATSTYVLFALSLLVVLATETLGLWYLYNKMVIPAHRFDAAFWVFQISVVNFVLNLVVQPYNAAIIAHERMDVYAYISIFDVVCKLLICYLVMISPIDRLVFYAILLCLIGVVDRYIYRWFCKKHFKECTFKLVFDKKLFSRIFSFAGWNFIGSSAAILRTQGASLLLNAFGGPVINAANGISNTITSVVVSFVGNFTTAFNPQITKRYAAEEYDSLMELLIYGSKYSYYLMYILALPIMFNANYIFKIWLGIVPEHTVSFARWTLIFLLLEAISRPIITAKSATGDIKIYQIVVGGILLLMLPISYIALKYGAPVESVFISNVVTAVMAFFARMYMLRGAFPSWSSRIFFKKVFLNVVAVSFVAAIMPSISHYLLQEGLVEFLTTSTLAVICSCLSIYYIGCQQHEREIMVSQLAKVVSKVRNLHKR